MAFSLDGVDGQADENRQRRQQHIVQIAGQRGQADHTEQNDQNRGEATQRHEGCANDADPQQCLRVFHDQFLTDDG